jgi:hypothetical protein
MKIDKLELAARISLASVPITGLLALWLDGEIWNKLWLTSLIGLFVVIVLINILVARELEIK